RQVEYENHLAAFLLDPSDPAARAALTEAAAARERARARLAERSARAPRDGVVTDVRVRPGMRLEPGDHLMTVAGEDAPATVIALLPGGDRPELREGMELRLELAGHARADIRADIVEIGGEVIGPREARRFVGAEIGDALAIRGPVVLVRARLRGRSFESGGDELPFHDGMIGAGEVRVGSRRLLAALWPGAGEG
ncbi:MAG TPA: HlyD family secretion protein, partial [Kofleriaceae bacterium]|nr:HlyD family secretion protein [Kofleriaceae bacterium]